MSQRHHGHDAEVSRIENVLAADAEDELTGDRDRHSNECQHRRTRSKQQAEGERRDQGTFGIESGESPQSAAGPLHRQRGRHDHDDTPERYIKMQEEKTVPQQQG